ncbi:hypothetical protein OIU77_003487 [Salix suchowensis]|uniref:Uncharacterized protein n=1 Tax=Salix suchowensis TaxID=1278906 RepID=A0ABQ9B1X9_9ROSI|nr:hypothetical protein OIU77_003487 [Salix suchowensis]
MLRALSTCRNHGGYERLVDEPVNLSLLDGKLKRAKSVPASVFGSSKSRKLGPELALQNISPAKPSSRKVSKSHPLFSLFNNRRKKKPTARPEFASSKKCIILNNKVAFDNLISGNATYEKSSLSTNELQIKEQSMEVGLQWKEDLMLSV